MLFTKEEFAAINTIIQLKEDNTARTYDLATRRIAELVFDKVLSTTKDNKYLEAEMEFSTQEKSFIITCIPVKQSIADGKLFDKLIEKLA